MKFDNSLKEEENLESLSVAKGFAVLNDNDDEESDNVFKERICLVSASALYTLDGKQIINLPNAFTTGSRKKKTIDFKADYILVLKKTKTEYYVISGLEQCKRLIDNGAKLVPVAAYSTGVGIFTEIVDMLTALKTENNNLNFFECSEYMDKIIRQVGLSQKEMSAWLNISQPSVGNKLRLLKLDETVRRAALVGRLSERHCRAILGLEKSDWQLKAIAYIVKFNTSSKKTESIVKYLQKQLSLGIEPEEFEKKLDNVFLTSCYDLSEEVSMFINNLQRDIRILKSLGVDINFVQKDRRTCWEIQILLSKMAS